MGQMHKIRSLSKLMSYILRHRPDEFGLVLDGQGFLFLKELHQAITEEEGWSYVRMADILQAVYTSDRDRFEIEGKRIRASCGHSLPTKVTYESSVPPKTLYHGTRRKAYPSILRSGLRPMGRQYVHLSTSEELALRIGRRRDPQPVLLIIDAERACHEGVVFFRANELIYLVETLAVEYFTGPPIPEEEKAKEVTKERPEKEPEPSDYVLFARGLHPHKDRTQEKRKGATWKREARKYRRQRNR